MDIVGAMLTLFQVGASRSERSASDPVRPSAEKMMFRGCYGAGSGLSDFVIEDQFCCR